MLTREELIGIGVNPDNMTYPNGEMNVIVQCFGTEDGMYEDEMGERHPITELYPDIYHPRKDEVYMCGKGDLPFETDEDRRDWVAHLRDSAERLKIMSHYLSVQADEIEEFGYPKTHCYYPE
jgi:hypothetical protein